VCWKRFIAEYDTWKKEKDLKNVKKTIVKFKARISVKVRR